MACHVRDIARSIRIVLRIVLLAVGAFRELPTWGSGAVLVVGPCGTGRRSHRLLSGLDAARSQCLSSERWKMSLVGGAIIR